MNADKWHEHKLPSQSRLNCVEISEEVNQEFILAASLWSFFSSVSPPELKGRRCQMEKSSMTLMGRGPNAI